MCFKATTFCSSVVLKGLGTICSEALATVNKHEEKKKKTYKLAKAYIAVGQHSSKSTVLCSMLENRQIFEERRQTQRALCPSLANRTETSSKHLVTTSYTTVKQVARPIETPQHRQTDARAIDIGPAAATKIVIKSQHTSRCGSGPHAIELLRDNKKRPLSLLATRRYRCGVPGQEKRV